METFKMKGTWSNQLGSYILIHNMFVVCINLFTAWNKHLMHDFINFTIDFFKLALWIQSLYLSFY